MQPPPTGQPPQVDDLRAAFAVVTAGWSENLWLPRAVLIRPHVAVVEEFIERDNPVFAKEGDDAFALDREAIAQPTGAAAAAPAGLVVRPADTADHGTGVAWIIAGRGSAFGPGGLAPSALLFHLPNALDDLIRKLPDAVAQHNVHVVNISAYWRDNLPTDRLSRAVNNFSDSALFVVAAGNNLTTGPDGEVCQAFMAYPACWGDRKNVLVVTATNKDRTALLPPVMNAAGVLVEPGANWSATAVHVAAPGEGYYVPGANGAYVPARGSSFATPLVTATAALLYAQGVQRPSLIKQRILATADPVAGLAGRVKAGVLNVRRALSDPFLSVVTTPDGEPQPMVVVPGQEIEVATSTGLRRKLPLDSVRRLHKHGTAGLWRIVYATGQTLDTLEIEEDVDFTDEARSVFRYFPVKQVVTEGPEPQRYWVSQADRAQEEKLVDYVDFVGPAIPPGR
jgi:subtilisin family serine protease